MKNIIPYFCYIGAAFLLKAFSLNALTKTAYRKIGNAFGKTSHSAATETDMTRGFWLYKAIAKSGINLNRHSKILELGTGWNHFYGLFLRHFIEAKFVLFDIQDNRQWESTKLRCHELYKRLSSTVLPPLIHVESKALPEEITEQISKSNNFNNLYAMLNIDYIIESNGNLKNFRDNEFDIIFSVDVFEHIYDLNDSIRNIYRMLKPGGLSIHQIGLDDHLTHYSPKMSSKQYLRYSDKTWQLLFQNKLQYFNRKQASEYLSLFSNNNFQLISVDYDHINPYNEPLKFHSQYTLFDMKDLLANRAYIVHQKGI